MSYDVPMLRAMLIVVVGSTMALGQALPVFEPMQPELLGAGSTFTNAFADYDNDGDPDLFVGFDGKPNRLYRNDKGTFVDVAVEAGVVDSRPTRAAAWGDFDADGDADLMLGFTPLSDSARTSSGELRRDPAVAASGREGGKDGSVLKLYRNTAGTFTDTTADAGLRVPTGAVRQPAWVDYDADGDLDL